MGGGFFEADAEGPSGEPLGWVRLAFSTNLVLGPLVVCISRHFTVLTRRDTSFILVFGMEVIWYWYLRTGVDSENLKWLHCLDWEIYQLRQYDHSSSIDISSTMYNREKVKNYNIIECWDSMSLMDLIDIYNATLLRWLMSVMMDMGRKPYKCW